MLRLGDRTGIFANDANRGTDQLCSLATLIHAAPESAEPTLKEGCNCPADLYFADNLLRLANRTD